MPVYAVAGSTTRESNPKRRSAMSDDVEFQLLTRSLVEKDFARGVVAVDRLRRGLLSPQPVSPAGVDRVHDAHEHCIARDLTDSRGRDRPRGRTPVPSRIPKGVR